MILSGADCGVCCRNPIRKSFWSACWPSPASTWFQAWVTTVRWTTRLVTQRIFQSMMKHKVESIQPHLLHLMLFPIVPSFLFLFYIDSENVGMTFSLFHSQPHQKQHARLIQQEVNHHTIPLTFATESVVAIRSPDDQTSTDFRILDVCLASRLREKRRADTGLNIYPSLARPTQTFQIYCFSFPFVSCHSLWAKFLQMVSP